MQIYKQYFETFFTVLVPLLGLIGLNLRIYKEVKSSQMRWAVFFIAKVFNVAPSTFQLKPLKSFENGIKSRLIDLFTNNSFFPKIWRHLRNTKREERTLGRMLLWIVLIFLGCHFPRIYLQSYRVSLWNWCFRMLLNGFTILISLRSTLKRNYILLGNV